MCNRYTSLSSGNQVDGSPLVVVLAGRKLLFSNPIKILQKSPIVADPKIFELAATASVLTTSGEPSTWFPLGQLVEQECARICS